MILQGSSGPRKTQSEAEFHQKLLHENTTYLKGKGVPFPRFTKRPGWIRGLKQFIITARVTDYYRPSNYKHELAEWLKSMGASITMDVKANQRSEECGYVAAYAAVCSQKITMDGKPDVGKRLMSEDFTGGLAAAYIRESNVHLDKHSANLESSAGGLTDANIVSLAEKSWRPHFLEHLMPRGSDPNDAAIRKAGGLAWLTIGASDLIQARIVNVLFDVSQGTAPTGVHTFISNTKSTVERGFHWIHVTLHIAKKP